MQKDVTALSFPDVSQLPFRDDFQEDGAIPHYAIPVGN